MDATHASLWASSGAAEMSVFHASLAGKIPHPPAGAAVGAGVRTTAFVVVLLLGVAAVDVVVVVVDDVTPLVLVTVGSAFRASL
jgi:hypothetical protein